VGIELVDLRIEGKRKLSQNRNDTDREGAIDGLAGGSPTERSVAKRMTRHT
jgi:predicted FMN-binding regulatory protein PaiB